MLWETLDSEIHVIRAQHTRGDIVCVFGLHNSIQGGTVSNATAECSDERGKFIVHCTRIILKVI